MNKKKNSSIGTETGKQDWIPLGFGFFVFNETSVLYFVMNFGKQNLNHLPVGDLPLTKKLM